MAATTYDHSGHGQMDLSKTDWGNFELRTMNSLEQLMSSRGYPSLFATGETSGREPLVDRQHPLNFFMELSGTIGSTARI